MCELSHFNLSIKIDKSTGSMKIVKDMIVAENSLLALKIFLTLGSGRPRVLIMRVNFIKHLANANHRITIG
ncbi:MAG: hypothetical protein CML20_17095 [Rheinheimera sp.]|nr:hypothetical protein [Rheinheimera sp.]|tara:strand:+ start:122905 stop:123117 length:213 start_codon:yes stop_codon:yes gene_type:complete